MLETPTKRWRALIVAALTAATVSFHYGVLIPSAHGTVIHAIHGRLCYVPIILAAIWFGVRGGLFSALAITALTLPYPKLRGITDHHTLVAEYTEMVFYVAIGLMTGVLIERQWRARERSAALERELARSERLSSLGQMAAGLAHEIKNPLGSIQGAAEILGDDAPVGSKQRDLYDVLRKESRRLNAVVDDFLGFAKPRPPQLAPLDVAKAIERASAQVELDASARRIEIARDVSPNLPRVAADAEQIHQVLLNLLLNAIAASRDGDRVTVAARSTGRTGDLSVAISDRGAGIPADILPRVFDPFFTTKEDGTGLGLSISHTIVRDHGGTIDIESTPGGGTTVTIALPANGSQHG